MMDKKRSVGITIFGWLFIFSGIILLIYYILSQFAVMLNLYSPLPLFFISLGKRVPGIISDIVVVTYFILLISSGFGLIKLHNFYRKLIISLFLLPTSYIIFFAFRFVHELNPWIKNYVYFYKTIEISLWDRILAYLFIIGICLPSLSIIFFFTRPKVKEQFK